MLAGSTDDQSLSSWLGFQCKLMRKGLLSSARAAQLLALGLELGADNSSPSARHALHYRSAGPNFFFLLMLSNMNN